MKLLILMLLPGINYGFLMPCDTHCNAINDATCSLTLGGNILLQVMNNASGYRIQFSNGSKEMFKINKGVLVIYSHSFINRTEALIENGTIKIKNVQWEDAGKYKVEIYNSEGTKLKNVQVTLEVKVNPWPIVVFASASVGAFLLILFISCCIYRKVRTRKSKTGGGSAI